MKSCIFTAIMQRNAAVFIVVFLLFCLSFNYTFPLHRDVKSCVCETYHNQSETCKRSPFENEPSTLAKSLTPNELNNLTEDDIRTYEQMVIMKKYPYLDVKEFELKFNPSMKVARQSKFETDETSLESEPSLFFEPPEDRPHVEIISRGLSGFSIPNFKKRLLSVGENKVTSRSNDEQPIPMVVVKKSSDKQKLNSLRTDVVNFYEYVKLNK